jgi:hypothetical protein
MSDEKIKRDRSEMSGLFFVFLFLLPIALRPGGPRRRNAAAPGAISLRSIAPAKAAYAATGSFSFFILHFSLFVRLSAILK